MSIAFEGNFDWEKFQMCSQYIQDSLDWLRLEAERHRSPVSLFPPKVLERTAASLRELISYGQCHAHNEKLPISRLPPEILSHVFMYLRSPPTGLPSPKDLVRAPPIEPWHRASLVCRHWRLVILATPGLWTTIVISSKDAKTRSSWRLASLCLSRSGALPLDLQLPISSQHNWTEKTASRLLGSPDRIRTLRISSCTDIQYLRSFLPNLAAGLEVLLLATYGEQDSIDHEGISFPRLQVLSVRHCNILRISTMRELRHLSLMFQRWTGDDLRSFFDVLRTNPHLEELCLDQIGVHADHVEDFVTAWEQIPATHLPSLKRLLVHDYSSTFAPSVLFLMTVVLQELVTFPIQCTRLSVRSGVHPDAESDIFQCEDAYPADRLFVSARSMIGTDGTSACVITTAREINECSLLYIHPLHVRELWLDAAVYNGTSNELSLPAIRTIMGMQNVTRLVLVREIPMWLELLGSSLPALAELHILRPLLGDGPGILQFLIYRWIYLPVKTLRFIGYPSTKANQAFSAWKNDPLRFGRFVREVIFEEVCKYRDDMELLSERFGLPEACDIPSPFSEVWQSWSAFSVLTPEHYDW